MELSKLTIPCSYQGGKQRLASQIVDVICEQNEINEATKFYDLCCGSGAVSIELVKRGIKPSQITMVDKSPWGLFWELIGKEQFSTEIFKFYIDDIPKDISKIKNYAKQMIASQANDGLFNNMIYKFLILQACSFGSSATWVENNRWKKAGGLRDYWLPTETSSRRSPVNPMMPMPDTLFNRVVQIDCTMEGVKGYYGDVMNTEIEENAIIYIDPPYENTHFYGYTFDYKDFLKLHNNKIYISEGKSISENSILLSSGRSKGGISGNRKKANEEWLNIFN